MTRRFFLASIVLLFFSKKYVFKIKTKSGSIINNVLIEASDMDAAKVKLMKRYPDCTILSSKRK